MTESQKLINQAWFTKYNPTTFDEIVFPDETKKAEIKKIMDNGCVQGNMISYGRGGVGKTTINKLIVNGIVKNVRDVFPLGRAVKDIDDLKPWLQQEAVESKQKIVVCEEFDLLSHVAQTALKNGLMENFQPNVAFIVTTNKIRKIDPALLRRFNIKLDFDQINLDGTALRLQYILEQEGIPYVPQDIVDFVYKFSKMNISDLISTLQASCISGQFNPAAINYISGSQNEELIARSIDFIANVCMNFRDLNGMFQVITNPKLDTEFYGAWTQIIKSTEADPNLNFEYIFDLLAKEDNLQNLAVSGVIRSYYQKLGQVKHGDLHLLSMIGDMTKAIYEIKGGSLLQRDVPLIG